MDDQHLELALKALRDEQNARWIKMQQLEAKLDRLKRDYFKAVEGFEEIGGAIASIEGLLAGSGRRPQTTPEFIIWVLTQADGPMTDEQMVESMFENEWSTDSTNPLGLLRSTISRMIKNEEVVRVAPATYDLPTRPPRTITLGENGRVVEIDRPKQEAILRAGPSPFASVDPDEADSPF